MIFLLSIRFEDQSNFSTLLFCNFVPSLVILTRLTLWGVVRSTFSLVLSFVKVPPFVVRLRFKTFADFSVSIILRSAKPAQLKQEYNSGRDQPNKKTRTSLFQLYFLHQNLRWALQRSVKGTLQEPNDHGSSKGSSVVPPAQCGNIMHNVLCKFFSETSWNCPQYNL